METRITQKFIEYRASVNQGSLVWGLYESAVRDVVKIHIRPIRAATHRMAHLQSELGERITGDNGEENGHYYSTLGLLG